jgi:2-hydroxychromene-2-carboxylate isomerase
MRVVIYGGFSCPYSYLASVRVDRLAASEALEVDWRAVESGRPPVTGSPAADRRDDLDRELTQARELALPGEVLPRRPVGLVNGEAAVAAHAESVSDGVQEEFRRRLFAAIWIEVRPMTSVTDVRRLIAEVMCPPEPVLAHLSSPDLPAALLHDPDAHRIARRSGGAVTVYGGPLTTAANRRARRWCQEWLALPRQVTPALLLPDTTVMLGKDALRYLSRRSILASPG